MFSLWIMNSTTAIILAGLCKLTLLQTARSLATRKDGPFRKLPRMPTKGPRDYENWKRLQRRISKPKISPRLIKLKKGKKKTVHKPKKKHDDPIKTDE